MPFYVEEMTEKLTKHINKCLRDDARVVDWAFYMEGKHTLTVIIDYLGNFHSKNQILVCQPYDIDELKNVFDYYLSGHLKAWNKYMKKKRR